MEYLIKFNDKKIALSRADIAGLYPTLEPYFLAIMQGLNEIQTARFVSEYQQFIKSLTENRNKQMLTEEVKESKIEEDKVTTISGGGNIIDFKSKRRIQ